MRKCFIMFALLVLTLVLATYINRADTLISEVIDVAENTNNEADVLSSEHTFQLGKN